MLMIKTWPGGSGAMGYVKDSVFENFWAYDTTYGLGNLPASLIIGSI
jgi:rhamnogalacturonan hydrolase